MEEKLNRFERNRITLNAWQQNVPHFISSSELIHYIEKFTGSRLVVLNTVRSAAYLANMLRDSGRDVLHLSTALTPKDRETVIEEVKRRLGSETSYANDWTLVATSCIECGIDFSFHYGFCELRSLSSYIQLGGRISRNSEYEDSSLNAFTITEDGFGHNPMFDIPKNVFIKQIKSGHLPSSMITDAVTQAFDLECKAMGGLSDEICKQERIRAFAEVAKSFRIIPEESVTVVADNKLARSIRQGDDVSAKELQKGSVHIRHTILEKLGCGESELPMLTDEQYDSFLGYMKSLI
ncbi:predicted helicase [Paenibacillus popilliae ATCC 14706]|uniref:Predicted helicase n=2 Tax=Paenibacillus popilliae TaxID=78057 RepID=M9LPQ5_PAEPP|nr:predicted helicase [Paenibacillus popilliae ATCC 14706]